MSQSHRTAQGNSKELGKQVAVAKAGATKSQSHCTTQGNSKANQLGGTETVRYAVSQSHRTAQDDSRFAPLPYDVVIFDTPSQSRRAAQGDSKRGEIAELKAAGSEARRMLKSAEGAATPGRGSENFSKPQKGRRQGNGVATP